MVRRRRDDCVTDRLGRSVASLLECAVCWVEEVCKSWEENELGVCVQLEIVAHGALMTSVLEWYRQETCNRSHCSTL